MNEWIITGFGGLDGWMNELMNEYINMEGWMVLNKDWLTDWMNAWLYSL